MEAAGLPRGQQTPAGPGERAASCVKGGRGRGEGAGCGGHSTAGSRGCQVPRGPGKPAWACAPPVARGATEGPQGRVAGRGLAEQAHPVPDGQWPEERAEAGRQLDAVAGGVWGPRRATGREAGAAGALRRAGVGVGQASAGRRGARAGHSRAIVQLGWKRQTETRRQPRKRVQQGALLFLALPGQSLRVPSALPSPWVSGVGEEGPGNVACPAGGGQRRLHCRGRDSAELRRRGLGPGSPQGQRARPRGRSPRARRPRLSVAPVTVRTVPVSREARRGGGPGPELSNEHLGSGRRSAVRTDGREPSRRRRWDQAQGGSSGRGVATCSARCRVLGTWNGVWGQVAVSP